MDACAVMVLYFLHADVTIEGFYKISAHVVLLVSHQVPPRWWIGEGSSDMVGTGVDQNQHHCLMEKGELQWLGEETPPENQPAQRLRWQPHQ